MRYASALVTILCVSAFAGTGQPAPANKTYYRAHKTAVRQQASTNPVVVNAASFESGVSPGGLATVFGTDLTSVTGVIVSSSNPLPTTLGGVSVLVNGIPAALFSVAYANGEDQISFQVPWETPIGPDAVEVDVFDQGFQTAAIIADSFTEDPGIFVYRGSYAVATAATDGSLIGPDNPAIPGEILVLYTTGLGPVSLNLPDGLRAPFDRLAYTIDPVDVFCRQRAVPGSIFRSRAWIRGSLSGQLSIAW